MSKENVETVRRFLVTMDSGDYEAAVRELDADAIWHNTGAFPGPTICSGRAEIAAFWKALFENFADSKMDIEETAEIGNTVVVGLHSKARGRASGAPVDVRWGISFRFERGSMIRADVYGEYGRALEGARLSGEDTHI
jgi:limonene-1,2-epoxide hydrolase